ncbi:MAG: SurA N-terminal domain-containing protein [Clostridia bacterium]|nr:SurA N-terminal domain-containing protein [Clostridia bacterium]
MKKQTKKTILIVTIVVLVVVAAILLIAALQQDQFGFNWFDRQKTIVDVNGTKITFGQYEREVAAYVNNLTMYNYYAQLGLGYTYYDTTSATAMEQLCLDVLNLTISGELYIQKAEELNLELTEDQQAALDTAAQDAIDSLEESIRSSVDYELTDSQVQSELAAYFKSIGCSKTTYMKEVERSQYAGYCGNNLMTYYAEQNDDITEDELLSAYEEIVTTNFQEGYLAGDCAIYEQQYQDGTLGYRYLYIPDGFVFVRVIKVSSEETLNELTARLDAGENFETILMEDVNEDAFIKTMDASEGYAIGPADCFMDNNEDTIFDAAVLLPIGGEEYTTVDIASTTTDDDGNEVEAHTYYIVTRVDGETGMVPFETYRDALEDSIVSYINTNEFAALETEWMSSIERLNDGLIVEVTSIVKELVLGA